MCDLSIWIYAFYKLDESNKISFEFSYTDISYIRTKYLQENGVFIAFYY